MTPCPSRDPSRLSQQQQQQLNMNNAKDKNLGQTMGDRDSWNGGIFTYYKLYGYAENARENAQSPKIASVVCIFGAQKKTVGDGVDGPFFWGEV